MTPRERSPFRDGTVASAAATSPARPRAAPVRIVARGGAAAHAWLVASVAAAGGRTAALRYRLLRKELGNTLLVYPASQKPPPARRARAPQAAAPSARAPQAAAASARALAAVRRLAAASAARAALVTAALVLTAALGCATTAAPRRLDARLALDCNVPDARVYVDDVFVGRAAELQRRSLAVASGPRRVELRADGWFTAYRDVVVPPAGRAALSVQLRPVPANEPAE